MTYRPDYTLQTFKATKGKWQISLWCIECDRYVNIFPSGVSLETVAIEKETHDAMHMNKWIRGEP